MARMLLSEIALASADVAATSSRLAKIARLAATSRAGSPRRGRDRRCVSLRRAAAGHGRSGVGGAARRFPRRPSLPRSSCSRSMRRWRGCRRSRERARRQLGDASSRRCSLSATEAEQRLLSGLFLGELRQGALEGVMVDAVAKAADVPAAAVRRAAMLAGDLSTVAEAAHARGRRGSGSDSG